MTDIFTSFLLLIQFEVLTEYCMCEKTCI